MGLSASQAKLLSITARLSDNELRSQTITSAKMALANQTTEASKKYIDALNSTKFTYSTYDLDGNKTYVPLTGSQLTTYGELKNQYGIINTNGQILVSETDAANYTSSANLEEFLTKYGIERIDSGKTQTVTNPEYAEAYEEWKTLYDQWVADEPQQSDYTKEVTGTDTALYQTFIDASDKCYKHAIDGRAECYLHVLSHMIDLTVEQGGMFGWTFVGYPKEKTTSTGDQVNIADAFGSYIHGDGKTGQMQAVSDAIQYGYNGKTVYAAEDPDDTLTEDSSKAEQLLSNYYYNEDGEKVLKTLEQKCIDLYYVVANYGSLGLNYSRDLIPALESFQEDMSLAFTQLIPDEEAYNNAYAEWSLKKPTLDVPQTIEEIIYKYNDAEKAQWYINLWHRMNGPSEEKDGTITTSEVTTTEENGEYVTTKTETTSKRWDILEDGLMNSEEWLKYALESGTVSLERVNYAEETNSEETGLLDAEWTSIVYSSATDISEETDEAAIAVAEAEYEQRTKEIEAKDTQYDNMLKLLDTEHSALQTEYESVKGVISKNIERTLKIYSA